MTSEHETPDGEEREQYVVVMNHEDQYSIWWTDADTPAGWEVAGPTGSREECLAYIDEVWTDMRPRSLRQWHQQQARSAASGEDARATA